MKKAKSKVKSKVVKKKVVKKKLDLHTKSCLAEFLIEAIDGLHGTTRREIRGAAWKELKPQLTPEQWQQALALLVQYLPMLITLLG